MVLRPGDVLGAYTIRSLVGTGGMGEVYSAHDARLDRLVAIKVLRHAITGEAPRARFFREAQSLARLRHPNVLSVFDVGEHEGVPYLVMELVEGPSLATLIGEKREMTLDGKLRFVIDVCDGLAHAHDRGIVHRDVKPANILIDAGRARLVDFGVARGTESTATASITGSPNYAAPEQLMGEVDHRSDLFSLGATLFELVTGDKAFPGSVQDGVLHRILHVTAPRLPPSLGVPGLGEAIDRALAKDPDRRFQSATEFKEALAQIAHEAPTAATVAAPALLAPPVASKVVTLRRRLLQAVSPVEIRRLKYELAEYLAQEPYDVEGRMLADEIDRTLDPVPATAAPPAAAWTSLSARRWAVPASTFVLAVVAVSIFFVGRGPGPAPAGHSVAPAEVSRRADSPIAPVAGTQPLRSADGRTPTAVPPAVPGRPSDGAEVAEKFAIADTEPASRRAARLAAIRDHLSRARDLRDRNEFNAALDEIASALALDAAFADTLTLRDEIRSGRSAYEERQAAAGEQKAISETVRTYVRGYNTLDADLVRRAFPAIGGGDLGALRSSFGSTRAQTVRFEPSIVIDSTGATATASGIWEIQFESIEGVKRNESSRVRLQLRKSGDAWLIVSRQVDGL